MKKVKWDGRYIAAGVTALLVIFGCIVFYMIFQRWEGIRVAVINLIGILSPFIWGAVIAYLLCPMMKFFQKRIFAPVSEKLAKTERAQFAIARSLSVVLSLIVAIAIVTALLWLIVPRFYESIRSIVIALPDFVSSANQKLLELLANYPEIEVQVQKLVDTLYTNLTNWLSNDLQPQMQSMQSIVDMVSSSLKNVVSVVLDLFIGIIVSCYLLYNKEKFGGQIKRIFYSLMSVEHVESVLRSFAFIDRVFMGFLGGKLVDSAIIGVLCYIGCAILNMPYATLIAVIVGVTNIIPYFGPFIGAIPSAFFILMVDPFKCLIFIVFILALQQFDGNILGPHILGNSVGISGFWVMFAIIVGSGLFGFIGMLIGVPVFVVLSTGFNLMVEHFLKKRGLPTETADYTCLDHLDPLTHQPVHKSDEDIPQEIIEEQ
ncbi:MAG: AI-2E family transporter [Candidatus Heteroscillospira sp.]